MLILISQNDPSSTEFYTRTTAALDRQKASDQATAKKLQDAKDAANAQDPVGFQPPQKPIQVESAKVAPSPDRVEAVDPPDMRGEKSVAGRKTMKEKEKNDVQTSPSSLKKPPISPDKKVSDVKDSGSKEETVKTKEELEIDAELNTILKKGPSKFL